MAQLTAYRAQHPEARDALFAGAPPPRAELLELIEHWPYAELAYEEHGALRRQVTPLTKEEQHTALPPPLCLHASTMSALAL